MKRKKETRPGGGAAHDETHDRIAARLQAMAREGRLPCARAFALARELDVPVRRIGEVADAVGIRIAACQLGCF